MQSPPNDLAALARRVAAAPATRWRALPLTVQLMLLAAGIIVAWVLSTRAYERLTGPSTDFQERTAHWQRAEVVAARVAAVAFEMQVAVRGFALTGDPEHQREARTAEHRFIALLDTLQQLASIDPEVSAPARTYRDLNLRWRAAVYERGRATTERANRRLYERERALFDSTRSLNALLLEELHERERAARVQADARVAAREALLLRVGPIIAVMLLLGMSGLLLRRTLLAVSTASRALAEGRYSDVRASAELGANREMRQISDTFAQLAHAIEEREQILQSDILQLREYEQLKSDFVSTVSHELRTPLTSMRGALGLVLSGATGDLPSQTRDLLKIANQNTERLIRLINDILDIEKIESGSIPVRRERCDMGAVLDATIAGVSAYAADHAVSLELVASGRAEVSGNPDRLIQVFTNLISNAVKYSPPQSAVTVTLDVNATTATISVRDRGPGIPLEFQSRIFGKFQQAEHSSSRRHGGTGLGLAIARAIVERHDGRIYFSTMPGEGTTFVVELPLAAPQRAHTPVSPQAQHIVLVVDPDEDIACILETLVGPMATIVSVATAAEALRTARERHVEAMILEPVLPGQSGLALARELRAMPQYAELPVIVFSSREHTADELEGVTLSASHAYVKSRDREDDVVMRLRAVLAARGAVA